MNRIAYTTFTGDLCTIEPDGSDPRKLTSVSSLDDHSYNLFENIQLPHSRYTWPTWSPDGKALAISRINTDNSYSLHSIDIATNNDGEAACLICILEIFYESEMIPTDPCPMCGGLIQTNQDLCTRCKRVKL